MYLFNSLWRLIFRGPQAPVTTTLLSPRLRLRMPSAADWPVWRRVREDSRDHLVPWEPLWPANALTQRAFHGLCRRAWRDWRVGHAYCFLIFLQAPNGEEGELVGGINLLDVQRGNSQMGTVGYWMARPHCGHGYMTEAVGLVRDFAFQTLRLHRLEATCMPHNHASAAVLTKAGFTEEGFAKSYLRINGRWEDHLLWGMSYNPAQNTPSS